MILSLLTFLPLAGALGLLFIPSERKTLLRGTAFAVSLVAFFLSVWLGLRIAPEQAGYQFIEKTSWIPQFGIQYFLGIDMLSVLMVGLTTLLTMIAIVSAFHIDTRVKEFFCFLLVLETAMLGVFLSVDLFLFYVFWELSLIPLYFLIGIWGGPRKEYAAIKFFLFTFLGSVFMLAALIAIYFRVLPRTFDLTVLAAQAVSWPESFQFWIFLGFFVAFAVKVPAFPFHTWLPLAHVEAPTPISVILAGVLLKMGGYGIIRFALPLAPDASRDLAHAIGIIAVINIVYGSLCAMAQKDMKRMIAYSSVSHMGYVLLGIASFNIFGLCGAVMQMVAHGLITGALFLLVGVLYDRTHSRDIDSFGELALRMPLYTGFMVVAAMASLGLPLLAGFLGEFLCFLGAYQVGHLRVLTTVALLGVLFTAVFFLLMLRKVFFSPLRHDWGVLPDMNARELLTVVPLLVLALLLGLFPSLMLNPLSMALSGQF